MDLLHLHLLLNHVPLVAIALAIGLLAAALIRGSRELSAAALIIILISAAATAGVFLTGEPAEERVEHLAGISKEMIERHEDAGKLAMGSALVVAIVSLPATVLLVIRRQTFPRAWLMLPMLVAVLTAGLLARAANLGGQIRHTELAEKSSSHH